MRDLTPMLIDIGLTHSEAKVFLSLSELGATTIGPIAERSGAAYSKVYLLLEKLMKKGLVSTITKSKTKYFQAASPRKLLDYMDRKQESIKEQRQKIEQAIPQLEGIMSQLLLPERAEMYEGYEGLKTVYEEGLSKLRKGDEILVMGASLGAYTDKDKYSLFFKQINRIRQEKGIKYKIIYNQNFKGEPGVRFWQEQKLTEVRFLLENTPGSVNIQGDRVLIIYWAKDSPKVFVMTSQIVADSFRQYFNALWQVAKI